MKELIITNEMYKFQNIFFKTFEEKKQIDESAMLIGWNIDAGRFITISNGSTIEITGNPQSRLYDVTMTSPSGETKLGQINTAQLAAVILRPGTKVYFKK